MIVRSLRRRHCFLNFCFASLIVPIRQDDHGLAARLLVQLFGRGQVDRVVQQRPLGIADRRNRSASGARNTGCAVAAAVLIWASSEHRPFAGGCS